MKKVLIAVAAIAALPATTAQAQDVQLPGVYFGVEGGLNWMFNTHAFLGQNVSSPQTGWAAGWQDRLRLHRPARRGRRPLPREHRTATSSATAPSPARISQTAIMANILYDFNADGAFMPYIGAGAGVAFVDSNSASSWAARSSPIRASSGVGYNIEPERCASRSKAAISARPTRTVARHCQLQQQQHHARWPASSSSSVRPAAAAAAAAAAGGAAVVHGVLRLGPLEPEPAGAEHDQAGGRLPSRPRAMPASRRPATPTRRARKPTTWRCRCVARTR